MQYSIAFLKSENPNQLQVCVHCVCGSQVFAYLVKSIYYY